MDTVTDAPTGEALKAAAKAPRKPRPSELAKKAAKKPKTARKPAAKKKAAKTKKPVKKRAAAKKPKVAKKRPAKKAKRGTRPLVRTERLELRITKREKAKLNAKCRKEERTTTSVISELIQKMK